MTTSVKKYDDGFFGGVITAMVTPMLFASQKHDDDCSQHIPDSTHVEVDYDAAAKLAVHLIEHGSDALVLSGTTGEAPTTHVEEKRRLIEVTRQALETTFPDRHIPLIAGTGSNDTVHAIRNSQVAEAAGADAVLVVTPYYSRPSQAGILEHYKAVATATKLPVILYDVPGRSGVTIESDTYFELAKIPNVCAIKDATGNVYRGAKILTGCNQVRAKHGLPEITLYSGDDSLLLPFLSVGARGIISVASHLVGREFSEVVAKFEQLDNAAAMQAFHASTYAIDLCNGTGQQAACTKAAMQSLSVIPSRAMRLPNLAIDDVEYDKIHAIIQNNVKE